MWLEPITTETTLMAWLGCRSCRGARLGVCCSAFRVCRSLGQEARRKSRKSCSEENNVVVMCHLQMTNFWIVQAKPSWFLLWARYWPESDDELMNPYRDGGLVNRCTFLCRHTIVLICPFNISNVFCSSLVKNVWEVHEVTRNNLILLFFPEQKHQWVVQSLLLWGTSTSCIAWPPNHEIGCSFGLLCPMSPSFSIQQALRVRGTCWSLPDGPTPASMALLRH